ncbi:MAG: hypothetical protein MUE53_03400 [Chitinophagales bacterium]|jgi:diacylglycerol kinase family enzyme|nr:hypothetical protein [Chitinophagales bacterium]
MSFKTLVVVNHLSGSVKNYNIRELVSLYLDLKKFQVDYLFIEDRNYLLDIAYLKSQEFQVIISVGGDGTLLHLAPLLINSEVVLGIIPIGSGNGFATHLGYKPRNVIHALEVLNRFEIKTCDIARINENYFFSNFGIGLDARIAKDYKIKKHRGFFMYAWLSLKSIWGFKAQEINYTINQKNYREKAYFFNVFNTNLFGYNLGIEPRANVFDGKLDLCIIYQFPFLMLPFVSIALLLKKPNLLGKYYKRILIDSITIDIPTRSLYQIDGDPELSNTSLEISVLPKALRYIAP